eukprot:2282090-Amphidinium_carterae.2
MPISEWVISHTGVSSVTTTVPRPTWFCESKCRGMLEHRMTATLVQVQHCKALTRIAFSSASGAARLGL